MPVESKNIIKVAHMWKKSSGISCTVTLKIFLLNWNYIYMAMWFTYYTDQLKWMNRLPVICSRFDLAFAFSLNTKYTFTLRILIQFIIKYALFRNFIKIRFAELRVEKYIKTWTWKGFIFKIYTLQKRWTQTILSFF